MPTTDIKILTYCINIICNYNNIILQDFNKSVLHEDKYYFYDRNNKKFVNRFFKIKQEPNKIKIYLTLNDKKYFFDIIEETEYFDFILNNFIKNEIPFKSSFRIKIKNMVLYNTYFYELN